jgi:CRP-like cAMP-binding protein
MELLIGVIKQFIKLSAAEESIVKELFTELNLGPGDYLLEEGKICRHVAFINKGLVRYFINNDGEERTMFFSKELEFVCNYPSFCRKQLRIKASRPWSLRSCISLAMKSYSVFTGR